MATPGEAVGYLAVVVAVPALATNMEGQCVLSALCRHTWEHTCLTSVKGT